MVSKSKAPAKTAAQRTTAKTAKPKPRPRAKAAAAAAAASLRTAEAAETVSERLGESAVRNTLAVNPLIGIRASDFGGAAQALFGAAVKQPVKAARHLGAYAKELGKAARGQSDAVARPEGQALRRPGLAEQPAAQAAAAGPCHHRQGTRPLHRRHQSECTRQGTCPPGGVDLRRHDRTEQHLAQPDGAEARGRHRRRQPAQGREEPGARPAPQQGAAGVGGQVGLRHRPQPVPVAGQRGLPQRGAGADPVPADGRQGLCAAAGHHPAAGQQVLCAGPVAGEEPDQVRRGRRPAAVCHQLVQPDQGAARLEHVDLRAGAGRGRRRGAPDHRQPRRQPVGRLFRRHDGCGLPGLAGRDRAEEGGQRDLAGVRARPGAHHGHDDGADGQRAGLQGAEGRRQAQGRRRRRRDGAHLRLAAAERPDLELLGQQLPARQRPAGLRHPVLERRHHAPAGGLPCRPDRHLREQPLRQCRRDGGAGRAHRHEPGRCRGLHRRRHHRPHHAVEGVLRDGAHLRTEERVHPGQRRAPAEPAQPAGQREVLLLRRQGRRAGAGRLGRRPQRATKAAGGRTGWPGCASARAR